MSITLIEKFFRTASKYRNNRNILRILPHCVHFITMFWLVSIIRFIACLAVDYMGIAAIRKTLLQLDSLATSFKYFIKWHYALKCSIVNSISFWFISSSVRNKLTYKTIISWKQILSYLKMAKISDRFLFMFFITIIGTLI